MNKSFIFFFKALLFGVSAMIAIPKEHYKKFFIYGFIFGGIGDIITVLILGPALHLIKYSNLGVFGILGLFSFWTPIAWTFTFMLFFYFLPVRKAFLYPYLIGFAMFALMVGWVLQNLGTFGYIGNYIYFAPLVFLAWFSLSAWGYFKSERIKLH